jgi:hypothetical protein
LIYAADGGYIQRFVAGSDENGVLSNDERRRLAQERRAGYGLEGNLLDTALERARTGNAVRPFEEYFGGVNNSGDQRGPGTGNTGTGQTAYGTLGNLAGEANRRGFTGLGGFLASAIPVGAEYNKVNIDTGLVEKGQMTLADLAALSSYGGQPEGFTGADSLGGFGPATSGGMAKGGPAKMTRFPRRDGPINGPGTGTSDDIPAMLSDGEFVFTAKAVRNAGGGSRRKGAARMYKLMKKLEGGAVKGN